MPATIASDSFTDTTGAALTSHTGELGATWAVAGGGSPVVSSAGRVYGADPGGAAVVGRASGTTSGTDQDVQATTTIVSGAASRAGPAGRCAVGAATCYTANISNAGQVSLRRYAAGAATVLGTYSPAGTSFTLLLQVRTATKKAFVDGVERISSTDDTLSTGTAVGVLLSGTLSDSTGVHLDSLLAVDPNASSGTDHQAAGTSAGIGDQSGAVVANRAAFGTSAGIGGQSGSVVADRAATGTSAGIGGASGTVSLDLGAASASGGIGDQTGAVVVDMAASGTIGGVGGVSGHVVLDLAAFGTSGGIGNQTGSATVFQGIDLDSLRSFALTRPNRTLALTRPNRTFALDRRNG